MKIIFCTLLFFSFTYSFSQIEVGSVEYDSLKRAGILEGVDVYINPEGSSIIKYQPTINVVQNKIDDCNCFKEPDGTYTQVIPSNLDDGSSPLITIPFDFCFYGQTYNQLYININGNITFENSLATFTPDAFPSPNNKIIAPFWGDVDLNGIGSLLYKITPTTIFVNWIGVGYFNNQSDKINTFQLTLTDGADPVLPDGNNIAFCYKDMQWTTGSSSGGTNGFGGAPATAGANKGDNIGFFQLAQFDHAGSDFDGALGNPDGISWLDNKSFYFNICNSNNIPPIPDGISSCDTFTLCALSDTANLQIKFLSPEENQITTLSFSTTNGLVVQEIENITGNTASILLQAIAVPGNEGYHTVTITATDDFVPAGITNVVFTVYIDPFNGNDINPLITPLEACQNANLSVLNGPYDTYLWDDNTVLATTNLDTAIVFGVTVSRDGCYKRIENFIQIVEPIIMDIQGSFLLCDGAAQTTLFIADSAKYSSISWGPGVFSEARDSMFINTLSANTYTLSLTDSAGLCSKDSTFTITTSNPIVLEADVQICSDSYSFTGNIGGTGGGLWTFFASDSIPEFANNNINTSVIFPKNGIYNLVFTDNNCPYTDTVIVVKQTTPSFLFSSDFRACLGETEFIFLADSITLGSVQWGLADQALDTLYSANLAPGTYSPTLFDASGLCQANTTFTITTTLPHSLTPDFNLCEDLNFDFQNNIPGTLTGTWSLSSNSGLATFTDATDINTTVTFPSIGQYTIIYSTQECSYTDTVLINIGENPTFKIVSDFYDCLNISEQTILGSTDQLQSIVWDPSRTQYNDLSTVELDSGTYNATITTNLGCSSDTTFTVASQPLININTFDDVCGLSLNMASNPIAPFGSWVKLAGLGSVSYGAVTDFSTTITVSSFGEYTFKYNEFVCMDADTFSVIFFDNPTISISDAAICAGEPFNLVATSNMGPSSIVWNTNEIGSSIIVNEKGQYFAEVTNVCGTASDGAFIDIRVCQVDFPNVFTPNSNDNLNHLFQVLQPSDGFSSFECIIVNRWGNLVYEFKDVFEGWNGLTMKGNEASPGTYFYKVVAVTYIGETLNFEGFVQLIRD